MWFTRSLAKTVARLTLGRPREASRYVRLSKHKQAVKRGENGVAVHAHESHHSIDWDCARVKRTVTNYWRSRATEAIQIRTSGQIMNFDSGLQLFTVWNPILNPH